MRTGRGCGAGASLRLTIKSAELTHLDFLDRCAKLASLLRPPDALGSFAYDSLRSLALIPPANRVSRSWGVIEPTEQLSLKHAVVNCKA